MVHIYLVVVLAPLVDGALRGIVRADDVRGNSTSDAIRRTAMRHMKGATNMTIKQFPVDPYNQWVDAQIPLIPQTPYSALMMGLVQPPLAGSILEFGVYSGTSINVIAKARPTAPVFGFDSFEGLPDDWIAGFPKGYFATDGWLPPVPANVQLVKGWFDETLPPFVAAHPEPVSLLHVDCDMYSSTKTVFDSLAANIVPGTVIVFDELVNYPGYRDHELKAFYEFTGGGTTRKFQWLAAPCPISNSGNVNSCAGMGCCSVAVKML